MFSKNSPSRKRPPIWLQVLVVVITLIAVAAFIFLRSQTYRETRKMATKQFNQQQLILARCAAAGIEGYYKELSEALLSLAKLPNIQQMRPECLQCIQHTYWGFPSRTSMRLLDNNGVLRFIYPFDGWRGELIGRDYSKEAFFQEVRETGRISVSGLIINEQGERRIRIAVPVYLTYNTETVKVGDKTGIVATPIDSSKPESNGFQGVLVGSLDPHIIAQDFISPIVSGKTGYAWLLNEEGIFIAHHEEDFIDQSAFGVRTAKNPEIFSEAIEQIQKQMMSGGESVGRYLSGRHRGQKGEIEKLIAYTPVHINNRIWSVAVCAPVCEVEEIISITKRSERYTLGFVILALVIGGLFFFMISYRWSRSLKRDVASRTKELRETSDYLNNLIRYANAPIIVWNPDKQVTIFNRSFEKLSGWTEAEMMEQPLEVLFPEESRADSLRKIKDAVKGKLWETVEIPILYRDGEIRVVLWNSANIYDEDRKTLIATVAQGQDVTERKRAEEALQESEEQLRTIVESMPVLMDAFDKEGKIIVWNRECERVTGYGADEIIGNPRVSELLYPNEDYKTFILEQIAKYGNNFRNMEWEISCKDCSTKTILWSNISEQFPIPGWYSWAIGVDITDRKRTEEALRESEDKYKSIVENTEDVVMLTQPDGIISYMSPACEEVLGYDPEDLVGQQSWLIHPDDIEKVKEIHHQASEGESGSNFEYRIKTKSGKMKWISHSWSPISGNGQLRMIVSILRDITERVRMEEELRFLKEFNEGIVQNMAEGIVVESIEGYSTFVNPAAAALLGYSPEELLGQHWTVVTSPSQHHIVHAVDERRARGESSSYELDLIRKDGTQVSVIISGSPRFEEGKFVGTLAVFTDITERKHLEEQLRQRQKMEAIGTLAGGVAHDFNNILTGIHGYTDLALAEVSQDDPLYRDLNEIRKAAARAANLTRQLLLFSRKQPMEITPLNLNTTIEDMMKMLNRLIGEDISITTELTDNLWTVNADLGTIEQVIMNLVVNARDAIPEGGEITIQTENVNVDRRYCKKHRYAHPGRFVCLSVQDTGEGMDREIIDRIFEPFFTTKGVGKGTGLGLSVVYGIVKQHEGWVNVESSLGKGANFKVYLPAVSTKPEEEQKVSITLATFRGKGERILLIEDDEAVQEFTKRGLSENGYVVFAAANAQEALAIFEKEGGNFGLIFSDVVLPDERGPELAERFLKFNPGISVVFASGHSDEKSDWSTIQKGGYPYLQKPYSLSDLLKVVSDALKGK